MLAFSNAAVREQVAWYTTNVKLNAENKTPVGALKDATWYISYCRQSGDLWKRPFWSWGSWRRLTRTAVDGAQFSPIWQDAILGLTVTSSSFFQYKYHLVPRVLLILFLKESFFSFLTLLEVSKLPFVTGQKDLSTINHETLFGSRAPGTRHVRKILDSLSRPSTNRFRQKQFHPISFHLFFFELFKQSQKWVTTEDKLAKTDEFPGSKKAYEAMKLPKGISWNWLALIVRFLERGNVHIKFPNWVIVISERVIVGWLNACQNVRRQCVGIKSIANETKSYQAMRLFQMKGTLVYNMKKERTPA